VITKRMLGIAMVLLGLGVTFGTLAVDLVGAGKWTGLGPAQQAAIAVGVGLVMMGALLIPLGDRPA
jgi:hypothetical protein